MKSEFKCTNCDYISNNWRNAQAHARRKSHAVSGYEVKYKELDERNKKTA